MMLAGCSVGPNYKRPPVSVPDQYYHAPVDQPAGATSLGDEKWWALFEDQELQNRIRTGLKSSYDVQIAASRILQAQAQVGITRADQFPTVSAGPGFTSQRLPGFTFSYFQIEALFSWDADFWGQYRRATEAARANLLAAQWNRQQVISALVSNIATAYFQMRELDLELDIARNTLASRRESLALTETLAKIGRAHV